MWPKCKPQNRRLEREHVLGVKLRSSHVRAARNRLVAVSLGAAFTALLGACLFWCGGRWALDRFIYQNKAFAIQDFDLRTDGVIAVDQLRHWTGIQTGANLLDLDLARVKRDLEMIPWVDSASVERIPPHTLRIRVFEREPVAQINVLRPGAEGAIDVAPYYINAAGYLMLPLDPRQRSATAPAPEPLPLLGGGLNPDDIQPGRRLKSPQLAAALQLLQIFQRSPMASLVDLSRIDLSSPDVLTVATDQGAEITFGLTNLDQQLRRWHEIWQRAQRENKVIASLDLAVTNNIPARWLEAGAATPSTPRLPQPLRPRRKHV
jgi:cell division septal protein FtsQ